jgi:hypothetical protein
MIDIALLWTVILADFTIWGFLTYLDCRKRKKMWKEDKARQT